MANDRRSRQSQGSLVRSLLIAVSSLLTLLLVGTVAVLMLMHYTQPSLKAQAFPIASRVSEATSGAIKAALNTVPVFPTLQKPLNVLIMGVDWNGDDVKRYAGTRSDTMMLLSFDPEKNRIGLISIPRDSKVELARGRGSNKINQAHALGGPALAMKTVADNFGVPVEHFVVVDTTGLKKIFELLGPIEVVVEKEMHYHDHTANLNIDLMPGKQLLNPSQLEGYVRFRHDARADVGRMERQQWFLRQAVRKLSDPAVLLKAPQMLQIGYECVKTDLTLEQIAAILSFTKRVGIASIVTATLPGHGENIEGINYYLLSPRGTRAVFRRLCASSEDRRPPARKTIRPLHRKRVRISIKYPPEAKWYARDIESMLDRDGWRIRHLIPAREEECRHAQLDVNTTRANEEVMDMIRQDLPAISEWPVAIKYGCGYGCDVTLVLPASRGLSTWQAGSGPEESMSPPMSI